jgi:hypothetical protein
MQRHSGSRPNSDEIAKLVLHPNITKQQRSSASHNMVLTNRHHDQIEKTVAIKVLLDPLLLSTETKVHLVESRPANPTLRLRSLQHYCAAQRR